MTVKNKVLSPLTSVSKAGQAPVHDSAGSPRASHGLPVHPPPRLLPPRRPSPSDASRRLVGDGRLSQGGTCSSDTSVRSHQGEATPGTEGHVKAESQLWGRGPRQAQPGAQLPGDTRARLPGPAELGRAQGSPPLDPHVVTGNGQAPGFCVGFYTTPWGRVSLTHRSLDAEVLAGAPFRDPGSPPGGPLPCNDLPAWDPRA